MRLCVHCTKETAQACPHLGRLYDLERADVEYVSGDTGFGPMPVRDNTELRIAFGFPSWPPAIRSLAQRPLAPRPRRGPASSRRGGARRPASGGRPPPREGRRDRPRLLLRRHGPDPHALLVPRPDRPPRRRRPPLVIPVRPRDEPLPHRRVRPRRNHGPPVCLHPLGIPDAPLRHHQPVPGHRERERPRFRGVDRPREERADPLSSQARPVSPWGVPDGPAVQPNRAGLRRRGAEHRLGRPAGRFAGRRESLDLPSGRGHRMRRLVRGGVGGSAGLWQLEHRVRAAGGRRDEASVSCVATGPGPPAETLSGRTHAKKSSISAAGLAALVASSSQPGQSMSNTTTGRGRPKTLSMVPLAWR